MIVSTARLTSKCRITIPAQVRRTLGLKAGDTVFLAVEGDRVVLQALPESWTEAFRGLGADLWRRAGGVEAILRERADWEES